jgi:5'-methylthioadenosine phosphorylase
LEVLARVPAERACRCGSALADAILTARDKIPAETRQKLDLLVGKYLSPGAKGRDEE